MSALGREGRATTVVGDHLLTDDDVALLDLDRPEREGRARGRSLATLLLAVAVVGAALGASGFALRSTSAERARPQQARLVAGVEALGVQLDPIHYPDPATAQARLRLSITNQGSKQAVITSVTLAGAGLRSESLLMTRSVAPGESTRDDVVLGLDCAQSAALPLSAQVEAAPAAGDGATPRVEDLAVVPVGPVAGPGGLCDQARQVLPDGWATPMRGRGINTDGADLLVELQPTLHDGDRVVGLRADSWLLTTQPAGGEIGREPLTLRLSPPTPACFDVGSRTQLPAGLQVLTVSTTGGSLATHYLPIGRELSRWLAAAYTSQCPNASTLADPTAP